MKTGCVYNITVGDKGIYIGSTHDFDERLTHHNKIAKTSNYKLYKAIRENNGKFVMTKLYDVEYENDVELRIEERKSYDEMKPNLNTNRPHITKEEMKEYNKQYKKQYNIDNYDKVSEQRKQYYIDNIDKIKEQKKQHYNDNSDKIKERINNYYIENKETIQEKQKQYNIKNKERLKEQRNKKITCDCGCEASYSNLKRHQQSKRHLKLMAEKNVNLTME